MRGESHHALLVHAMNGGVHVSAHEIDFRGESPMLGPGRVFTRADLDALMGLLSGVEREIRVLPACALYATPEIVALHLPGAVRDLAMDGGTVAMRVPDLVAAITRRGMRLVAVDGGRPTEASPVFQAPLPNMTSADVMCAGNTGFSPRPDIDIEHLRDLVESFLFRTTYTHGFRVALSDKARRALKLGRNPDPEVYFQRFAALTMTGRHAAAGLLQPMNMTLGQWLSRITAEV